MLNVGQQAPEFTGHDILTDQPFTLSDHKGKVVVIAFHGLTWCPPCQFAVPVLQELWLEYLADPDCPIQFVVVSVDEQEPVTKEMLEGLEPPITTPWLLDTEIPQLYEVGGTPPQYFFLDPEHRICHIEVGLFGTTSAAQTAGFRSAVDSCKPIGNDFFRVPSAVAQILFGVTADQGGIVIVGGKPKPIGPWDPLRPAMARDALRALAIGELAESVEDPGARRALQRNAWKAVAAASKKALSKAER